MTKILDVLMAAGAALAVLFGSFGTFARECDEIPQEVLRLHIPANSDSDYDQAIKLELRDMVLEKYSTQLSGYSTRDEAAEEVRKLLPEIEKTCCEFLEQQGADYGAHAELTEMYFTTRKYENVTLPAGNYLALRITLGSGEGHNWWCVMFPPLCLPAAQDRGGNIDAFLDGDELKVVESSGRYEPRFKIVEIIEELREKTSPEN